MPSLRALLVLGTLFFSACSGGAGNSSAQSPIIRGEVIERSEGFSERPGWADEAQPFSRKGEILRSTGYVSIGGSQRLETGFRAADSYARAELIRFLASRVVAVLEDKMDSKDAQVISERVKDQAAAWVEQIPVAGRYWEKRDDDGEEKLHIWSRIDLSPEEMDKLTERVISQSDELGLSADQIKKELAGDWDSLADPSKYAQSTRLPAGVFIPEWAKSGDARTDSEFQFTCHGMASDEKSARILAESQCSEKLCKLFGVQITAETVVREDLEGIQATSEVKERCPDVRVVGRENRYHTGECGPKGCIYWLQQSYPRSSYEEEKKRLEKPTVIRQQVVIQEGDKLYRDPAQCRTELEAYSTTTGLEARSFQKRSGHLHRALSFCQDIDGREVGLFSSLDHLLKAPLPSFTMDPSRKRDGRMNFLLAGPEFMAQIDSSRFLIERIQIVVNLVDAAILPMKIYDLNRDQSDQVEAVMKEVTKLPANMLSTSPHHRWSIYGLALARVGTYAVPYSKILRDRLLKESRKTRMSCDHDYRNPDYSVIPGAEALDYWGRSGTLDAEEWQQAMKILQQTKTDNGLSRCLRKLWGKDKRASTARVSEVTELIIRRKVPAEDQTKTFRRLVDRLDAKTQLEAYKRFKRRLRGSKKERAELAKQLLEDGPRYDDDCNDVVSFYSEVEAVLPEADVDRTTICYCLDKKKFKLSPHNRKTAVDLLFQKSEKRSCGHLKEEDWPEPFYDRSRPKVTPYSNVSPFGRYTLPFDKKVHQCTIGADNKFKEQVYVTVHASVSGGRIKAPRVEASLMAKSSSLRYKDKRPGYARRADIERSNRDIAKCVEAVLKDAELPAEVPVIKSPRGSRVWWEYWGKNRGGNYYE